MYDSFNHRERCRGGGGLGPAAVCEDGFNLRHRFNQLVPLLQQLYQRAIKNGAKIKAAAVVGGLTDLIQWDKERESIGEKVLEQLISPHNCEEYKKRSAYYWPEKINVPVLILHGEDDWRVKVSQAKKLSKKLAELGKVHELVIFPKGDHALRSHRPEKNRLILKWFDKYLKQ